MTARNPLRECDVRAGHGRRTTLALLFASALVFFMLAGPLTVKAQRASPKEYQIKALFLFNIVQFVTWPDAAFASPEAPIRIVILGDDPFAGALEAAVQGEKIRHRALVIERADRFQDVRNCHVLLVCQSESAQIGAIVSAFAGKPVLTVGDMPDFARQGGTINFYLEGQKIRFEVNRAAAQRCGVKLSSQLLGLARIVGPSPEAGNR